MSYIRAWRRWERRLVVLAVLSAPMQTNAQQPNLPPVPAGLPTISINDNRHPAGHLEERVFTLTLEARNGVWYPEGPAGIGLPVAAFAEAGASLQNPGPLVR